MTTAQLYLINVTSPGNIKYAKNQKGQFCVSWLDRGPQPKTEHVYRDGKLVVKWDLDNERPMKGEASNRLRKIIDQLVEEGLL